MNWPLFNIMEIYLFIGLVLALWGYSKNIPQYNFLSAVMLMLGWPIFLIYTLYTALKD